MFRLRRTLLAALALAVSCSEPAPDVRPCLVTRECRKGEQCVQETCRPRVAQACASDVECGPGGACLDAACAGGTACTTNLDCASGEACDVVQGMCVLGACDARGRCPNGGFCDARTKRCGPRRACARDDQCGAPNGYCDGGFCAPGCAFTGCEPGLACVPSTGRCGTAATCANDAACGAPASICEAGACVSGCGATGCAPGLACSPASGRCAPSGGCANDAACGAPASICHAGSCTAGCASTGCAAGLACNAGTGRCVGGQGCTNDNQCQPFEACDLGTGSCLPRGCQSPIDCRAPAGRCVSGTCIAGCATTGCQPGETCDASTGACSDGSVPETPCTSNLDCPGRYCLTARPPGGFPGICADMCGSTADCAPGRRCMEAGERPGVKVCLGRAAGSQVGSLRMGQQCRDSVTRQRNPSLCQSGICSPDERDGSIGVCEDACSSDYDCPEIQGFGRLPCRQYIDLSGGYSSQACMLDAGLLVSFDASYPYPCDDGFSFPFVSCATQACSNVANTCFTPCCISAECGAGSRCLPMLPYFPMWDVQTVTLMKGCAPKVQGSGTLPFGAACTFDGFAQCDSNRCIEFDASGAAVPGYCTDTCCRNADCPSGFSCVADFDADSGYSFSVCAKEPPN